MLLVGSEEEEGGRGPLEPGQERDPCLCLCPDGQMAAFCGWLRKMLIMEPILNSSPIEVGNNGTT